MLLDTLMHLVAMVQHTTERVPHYIGNDYTTVNLGTMVAHVLVSRYPVWLTAVWWSESSLLPNIIMPCFIKTLNENTTDNIELRACIYNAGYSTGTVAVFLIELYVH